MSEWKKVWLFFFNAEAKRRRGGRAVAPRPPQGAKGTKMPRGDKEQILAYAMAIPKESDMARFNAVIGPMCESIVSKGMESRTLAETYDVLLPKLMSGEVDVEKVEVA